MQNIYGHPLIYAFLCLAGSISFGGRYSASVGSVHPDFTLPSLLDGAPVSLSDFRGQKVLLINFASW